MTPMNKTGLKATRQRTGWVVVCAAWLALSGCAAMAPGTLPLGASIAEARQSFFGPTDEFQLPAGGTRLAFNMGKQTYMLDFDASGRLVSKTQALTEANFATVHAGMTRRAVLEKLGRPGQVFRVGYQRLDIWNYRYADGDCVWFQISINDADVVTDAAMGQDPACDIPSGFE